MEKDLGLLLSYLRALYGMYQHMHWKSDGENYYGDHLLYQRLYDDINHEIDVVAEKSIGLTGQLPSPKEDFDLSASLIAHFLHDDENDSDCFPDMSIVAENGLLDIIKDMMNSDETTDGLENLLQSIADKHEEHLYLLGQRAKVHESDLALQELLKLGNSLDQKGYYEYADEVDDIFKILNH